MINYDLKCLFVAIPKTASTSVRKIIGEHGRPHMTIVQTKEWLYEDLSRNSDLLEKIREQFDYKYKNKRDLVDVIFESYFKFSFVRNPWDRFVSLYSRKDGGIRYSNKMNFERFVKESKSSSITCRWIDDVKYQLDWIRDENKNILVDFIGKYENLNDDWKIVAKKLNVNNKLPISNRNMTRNRDYTKYYTNESRDIIYNKFKEDIDYFGYKFGE